MKKLLTLLFATLLAGAMTMPVFGATPQMGTSPNSGQTTQTTHKKKKKKGTQQPGSGSSGGAGSTTSPPPAL